MIEFTDEKWDTLCDEADKTIQQVISELPEPVKQKAEALPCLLDKYTHRTDQKILGTYLSPFGGPIIVYVGQIFEDCHQDVIGTMESVRQVYLHELAHAVGKLSEYEVRKLGL